MDWAGITTVLSLGIGTGMVLHFAVDGVSQAWWQLDELVREIL
jgi:hypothetical protein